MPVMRVRLSHPLRRVVVMARARTIHRCVECGADAPKWVGRCPGARRGTRSSRSSIRCCRPLPAPASPPGVAGADRRRRPRRVARGRRRAWPSSTACCTAVSCPGPSRSSAASPASASRRSCCRSCGGSPTRRATCLYATGEESVQQVRLRAERLGTLGRHLWLVAETSLPSLLDHVETVQPDVLAVDSIQTTHDPALSSAPGSVAQVGTARIGSCRRQRRAA